MKKNILNLSFSLFLFAATLPVLTSCTGDGSTQEETDTLKQTEEEAADTNSVGATYQAPEAFQAPFDETTAHYLELKNALVESNAQEAAQKADALNTSLQRIDVTPLEGEAASSWTNMATTLQQNAQTISGSSALAEQRTAFTALSQDMINAVELFGAENTLYLQHCPMANKNSGGSWLSSNKEIRNPYYGDAMLKCGEVQAAITRN